MRKMPRNYLLTLTQSVVEEHNSKSQLSSFYNVTVNLTILLVVIFSHSDCKQAKLEALHRGVSSRAVKVNLMTQSPLQRS